MIIKKFLYKNDILKFIVTFNDTFSKDLDYIEFRSKVHHTHTSEEDDILDTEVY